MISQTHLSRAAGSIIFCQGNCYMFCHWCWQEQDLGVRKFTRAYGGAEDILCIFTLSLKKQGLKMLQAARASAPCPPCQESVWESVPSWGRDNQTHVCWDRKTQSEQMGTARGTGCTAIPNSCWGDRSTCPTSVLCLVFSVCHFVVFFFLIWILIWFF